VAAEDYARAQQLQVEIVALQAGGPSGGGGSTRVVAMGVPVGTANAATGRSLMIEPRLLDVEDVALLRRASERDQSVLKQMPSQDSRDHSRGITSDVHAHGQILLSEHGTPAGMFLYLACLLFYSSSVVVSFLFFYLSLNL
jgi:hypothetical protein